MNKVLELITNLAFLAVLSAIAIPSLTCIPKKAKATAALMQMRQIQKQCMLNRYQGDISPVFSNSNIFGYQITSNGSNSCKGIEVISAIPKNTATLPIFNFSYTTNSLTYSFKGEDGNNFHHCFKLICGADY